MQTRLQKRIQLEKERNKQLFINSLSEKDKQLLKDNPPNGLTDDLKFWLAHVKSCRCPYQ